MLIGVGAALVALAVCCFLRSRMMRHRSAYLAGVQLLTCAEVADAGPGRVAVAARTGAEPPHLRGRVTHLLAESGQIAAGRIYIEDTTGEVPLTHDLATHTLTERGDSPVDATTGFPNSSAAYSYVKDLWWSRKIGPHYSPSAPERTRFTYELTEEILPLAVPVLVVGTIRADDAGEPFLDRADRHDGATTLNQREAVGHLTAHARRWQAGALWLAIPALVAALAGILLAL